MSSWNQAPFIRLLIPFVAGILSTVYLHIEIAYSFVWLAALLLVVFYYSQINSPQIIFRFRWMNGILMASLFFICGTELTRINTEINSPTHFSKIISDKNYFLTEIIEAPISKVRSSKIEIRVNAVRVGREWKQCSGKAMLYLESDKESEQLKYGDVILLHAPFKLIPAPQNPSEFDYKKYLQYHNLNYQSYCKSGNWQNLHLNTGNFILRKCLQLRDYLLSVFIQNGIKGNEYAVGAALILGYEDKLNAELMSAYSASGALHVLSVSGLHIAIVFVVLNALLLFLEKIKHGALIKASILIVLLWFYAALTGLSPSVLRSAAMFTLIIVGKSLNRYTNIYNTLAASMFFLLLWNPYLIMEVGFQLSYLAVLGIVAIQPGVQSLWQPKSKLMEWVWSITSVSIAAQISTFPLGLLYFHQFPNYFLISNLIVIPLSSLVLYIGVAVCVFSKIQFLSLILCKLLSYLLWFLNSSVAFFEQLPHAIVQGIAMTIVETWIIYFILIAVFFFFFFQHIKALKFAMYSAIALVVVLMFETQSHFHQKKLIIYAVKGESAIDFIEGNRNCFFASAEFLKNKGGLLFHVQHNWWDLGMKETFSADIKELYKGTDAAILKGKLNVMAFDKLKILCINEQNEHAMKYASLRDSLDIIVISKNVKIRMDKLSERIKAKRVVFDSSNSKSKIKYWKMQCEAAGISYYDISSEGAFVLDLGSSGL